METVVLLAKHANRIRLPYTSFWKSLSNLLLMKYHEMEFSHVVQILYYLMDAGHIELTLDTKYLNKD